MTGQTIRLIGASQKALAHRLIDAAPQGAVVNIKPATRTLEQNSKMRAMLSDIARAKPQGREYTTEIWKCLFMDELGFKPNWVPSLDGGGVVNTGYRSSRLTKEQMSDMIENMYARGAEWGVQWSEPGQEKAA